MADSVAEPVVRFFNPPQMAALRRLGDLLMPAMNGSPSASEAHVPEFLDFLLAESPADRQQVYRAGLDALNASARKRFGKPFGEIEAAQAEELLRPLTEPWTYDPPADPIAKFLRAAKLEVRTATMNSAEWSAAAQASGRRGASGLYWYPIG